MIKYRLRCSAHHEFESWFRDSATYEALEAAGQVSCPECGDGAIRRAIMAPALRRTDRGRVAEPEMLPPESSPPPAQPPAAAQAMAATPRERMVIEALRRLRQEVVAKFDHVGPAFAEEARKIHRGEAEERGIYGEASRDEVEQLLDEGIEIAPLPEIEDDA